MDTRLSNVTITPEVMRRGALGMDPQEYVDRELHRYYAVLKTELRTVDLTTLEMDILVHANSSAIRSAGIDGDSTELEDLAAQKAVDGKRLAMKVKSWTPGQTMAVLDAKERYWFSPAGGMKGERQRGKPALDTAGGRHSDCEKPSCHTRSVRYCKCGEPACSARGAGTQYTT